MARRKRKGEPRMKRTAIRMERAVLRMLMAPIIIVADRRIARELSRQK